MPKLHTLLLRYVFFDDSMILQAVASLDHLSSIVLRNPSTIPFLELLQDIRRLRTISLSAGLHPPPIASQDSPLGKIEGYIGVLEFG